MIGHYKDEPPFHFNIGQSICGRAFDRVELTRHDFHFFFEMKDSPTQAAMVLDWLSQNVYCRLTAPPKIEPDLECYFTSGCDGKIIRSHSWETYCTKCNKGAEDDRRRNLPPDTYQAYDSRKNSSGRITWHDC